MKIRPVIGLALLAMICGAAPATAQDSGSLRGRVVDATSDEPVSGAVVTIDGEATRSTVTDAGGRWQFTALPHGEYRLRVKRLGYSERMMEAPVTVPSSAELMLAVSPSALPLDAVVVTGSRRLQRLADSPVTIELVSRDEIEQSGVSDLSRVLFERTGIELQAGVAAGEGVMLQGLGSERVLVLIDGQPLVGRISGQVDISRIPVSIVERVEVVKGPQSSLYGSEAMGGVINIITRGAPPRPWQVGVNFTGGSQGRADASTSVAGTVGDLRYLVDGGRRVTELTPGRSSELGALARRWDGIAKVGWSVTDALELELQGLLLEERQRWQGGQLFTFSDNRQVGGQIGAVWSRGDNRLSPTIYWSEFDHLSRRATSSDPVAGTGEQDVQRLLEAELLYNGVVGPVAFDVGFEAKRESTLADRVVGERRAQHSVEPFAQAAWTMGALSLVPGGRVTWSEQWGTHLTPSLAGMYRPLSGLAFRASVGRGFRAPSFKELYMEFLNLGDGFGYTVRGNSELGPETSTNLSGGVEWSVGPAYVRGQLFRNDFDDFIETRLVGDADGVTIYSYGNVADGRTAGAELEGGVLLGELRAEGGYSYLLAEEGSTGARLLGRPEHSARFSLEGPLGFGPRASLAGVYTGTTPVQRTDAGTLERGGFLRFDVRLSQPMPAGLELAVGAQNVLNEQPEHWPGYSGRHLYLALGWTTGAAVAGN